MSFRLTSALALTLGARLFSALLSFLVFAQVAAALPAGASARVMFFSFAFGFALATFRSFHVVTAGITGGESRAQRMRRVRAASRAVFGLAAVLSPGTALLLHAQGVGWGVALAGSLLTVVCAPDPDLARAVLRRSPLLPLQTAAGGALGSVLILVVPSPDEAVCALAFLLQWAPVAIYQMAFGRRLVRPVVVGRDRRSRMARSGIAVGLLLAGFDGAILNAPFILALPLPAIAALDLAVGNRLFVASLALFSLVASWVISGDMPRLARRVGVATPLVFIAMQSTCGLLLGSLYAALYAYIAGNRVSGTALLVFVLVLLSYTCHAAAIRFAALRTPVVVRVAAYGATLAGFYALMLGPAVQPQPRLWLIVLGVVVALVAPASVLGWRAARDRALERLP